MDLQEQDAEMLAIWQNILPSADIIKACKRQRSETPPHSRRKDQRKDPRRAPRQGAGQGGPDTQELTMLLARLAIRHEDAISTILSQQQFILHMKNTDGSMIPLFMKASQEWHQQDSKQLPLRCLLAQLLMDTLQARTQKMMQAEKGDEFFKACQKQNLVTEDQQFPFLSWNHQQKKLVVSKDKPLQKQELEEILEEIRVSLQTPQNVLRFHALRRLPQDQDLQATDVFPWVMTVTPQLHQQLQRLCFHSIWLLVAVDLKRQTAARSPLAKQVETHIRRKH